MKTAHPTSTGPSHASALQAPRRPGMSGPAGSPADSFAQLLSGLGDASIEAAATDPNLATSSTVSPVPDAATSAPAPAADSQAVALLLGLPTAPVPVGATAAPESMAADAATSAPAWVTDPAADGQAAFLLGMPTTPFPGATSIGNGPPAGADLRDLSHKPLPSQASPVAALATGRPLSPADSGTGQGSQPSAGTGLPGNTLSTSDSSAAAEGIAPGPVTAAGSPKPGDPAAPTPLALQAGTPSSAEPVAQRSRTAPGRLVSAAARLSATTGAPPQSLERLAREGEVATRSWHMNEPGQPGSGLADDALAGLAPGSISGTSTPVSGGETRDQGRPGEGSGQGASTLSGTEGGGTAAAEGAESSAAPAGFARSLDQALQSLGAQVSVWSSQKLQHATMDLDTGRGPSLQVDVTLEEGKVELQFRSDDPTLREAIRAHAQSALADLLSRQGMDLTGLSVSTQGSGRGAGQDRGSPQSGQGRREAPALERLASLASEPQARVLRSDRALDMYA
jgi:Flagellar hook-length control protein FliK